MKIIIAPDKFKGSLTSMQACKNIAAGILQVDGKTEILQFPMADGGDGFAEVLQYYWGTQTVPCMAVDPLMRSIETTYQWDEVNKTAIIAIAAANGLQLLPVMERDPLQTSTYGTGLLIQHAIVKGAEKIILGLGGSATNDAATGILAALGFTFLDKNKKAVTPVGENLKLITEIVPAPVIPSIHFQIACDVQNVLFGRDGAAHVYAAQKGADVKGVKILDEGLRHFAAVVRSQTAKDIASFAGAGAAGGVAAGMMGYFDIEMAEGAKLVMEASRMEEQIKEVNLIITGEGKLDSQSNKGKVVKHIAELGKQYNIPVMALCGIAAISPQEMVQMGLLSVTSIVNSNILKEEALKQAGQLLNTTAEKAFSSFLKEGSPK